jgi:hypothetical protein
MQNEAVATMKFPRFWSLLALLPAISLHAADKASSLETAAQTRTVFEKPTVDYSTGPLWVWNDMLTESRIRSDLRDLASQSVKQVWVHPRPGLMTPYFSASWFQLWQTALDEAAKLGMKVWIYDENSYPSGFAGGMVPDAMPESRGRGMVFKKEQTVPKWQPEFIAAYRVDDGKVENVTARVKSGDQTLPAGEYLVATQVRSGNSPWHANRSYVNLLSPGVTEKFLEVTMEPYRKEIGKHFGKRVPGVFTDEPNIRPAGDWPWSEVLVGEFQKRWGYDLLDHLPSLSQQVGDWRKVRHNYFEVLNAQFIEHWAKPYFEYCEKNGLKFTGHYWDHEWPNCQGVPDNMAMYGWHQLPAIDCLMNQYAEHTHAQFGNVRMVRELTSVANQLGRRRTLCETYGAGGWDLRFEDMKRIGDWLQVLGVNTINQHLTYSTIRGARKRDHPQSFSYHTPWWPAYHLSAEYFAHLSAALSQGEQINKILIIEPTTTAWMYQGDGAKLGELGDAFFKLLLQMESMQVEYDLVSEDIMARHGKPGSGTLHVGQREYSMVIIPPLTENMNSSTKDLLDRSKVRVECSGAQPPRIDGAIPSSTTAAADYDKACASFRADPSAELRRLTGLAASLPLSGDFAIHRADGDAGILLHQRRQLADAEILFLVNTSIDHESSGEVTTSRSGVQEWDVYTGKTQAGRATRRDGHLTIPFSLPPSGSKLLLLSSKSSGTPPPVGISRIIQPASTPKVTRDQPNVLTLDFVDVTAGGKSRTNIYVYAANRFVWQQNGMDQNPWDSAVQFKDELISKKFPANSGFSATYKFNVEGNPPSDLAIVIERPDIYHVSCNGSPLSWTRGEWWLDRAFGRIPLGKLARAGENTITIEASPFTMFHELESAYLLGNFSLKSTRKGFAVTPPCPLDLGTRTNILTHGNSPERTMWISAGIGFSKDGAGNPVEDRNPWLLFDLGKVVELGEIQFWNYNEGTPADLSRRGVKEIRIRTAVGDPTAKEGVSLGEFTLTQANGVAGVAQSVTVPPTRARYVRIDILSNANGVHYPCVGDPDDNGFVGLAEARFLTGTGTIIPSVKAQASSELKRFNRLASMLTDGSGLGQDRQGWNRQGLPFYSAGVTYAETFQLSSVQGKYRVRMDQWYGSVAEVKVNGKPVGYIDAPPWECQLGKSLRPGANLVEVTIFGTLKNTLGPHHGNFPVGSAWPSMFKQGPEDGIPSGSQYATVSYGLFAPFTLVEELQPKPGR